MSKYAAKVKVPEYVASAIDRYCGKDPVDEEHCLGEDSTISVTAKFETEDSMEMDIKLCGVQYREGECNTPFTEAVLFRNGSEVCHTEPAEDFFGMWEIEYDGNTYVAEVAR